jgi:hypothetical protein
MHGVARGTAVSTRFEWTQRDGVMESLDAVAASVGIARRLVDARKFELAAGIAPRFELRFGSDSTLSSWNRAAIAGDITLELVPRALPATLGLRFHKPLTDPVRSSALLLELAFEVR